MTKRSRDEVQEFDEPTTENHDGEEAEEQVEVENETVQERKKDKKSKKSKKDKKAKEEEKDEKDEKDKKKKDKKKKKKTKEDEGKENHYNGFDWGTSVGEDHDDDKNVDDDNDAYGDSGDEVNEEEVDGSGMQDGGEEEEPPMTNGIDYEAKRLQHHIDLSMDFVRRKLSVGHMSEMAFAAFKKLVYETLERVGMRKRNDHLRTRMGISSTPWGRQFKSERGGQNPAWKTFLEGIEGDAEVNSLETLDAFLRDMARKLIEKTNFKSFFKVFDFMYEELHMPFTVVHYNMMIDVHLQQGFFRGAKKILQDMVVAGVQPNATTFNYFMRANIMFDKVEMAEDVLEEMKAMDVEPDVDSFNWIIRGYGKRRNMNKMEEMMENIEKKGLEPNADTYIALCEGYLQSKNMRMACQHYDNLMNKFGLTRTFERDGVTLIRPRKIKQLFFVTMIQESCRRADIDMAMKVLGHLEEAAIRRRSLDPYFAMAVAFVNRSNTAKAEEMLERAVKVKAGFKKPDLINKIISGYIQERQPLRVIRLLDRAKELKIRPSPREISDTVIALIHQNRNDEARALAKRVRKDFKVKIFDDAAQLLESSSRTFENVQITPEFTEPIVDSLERMHDRLPLIAYYFVMSLMQYRTLHTALTADYLRTLFFALVKRHQPHMMEHLFFDCIRPLGMQVTIGQELLIRHIATEYCNVKSGARGMREFYGKLVGLGDITESLLFVVAKRVMNLFERRDTPLDADNRTFIDSVLQKFVITGKRTHVMEDRAACQSAIACLARLGRIDDAVRMVKRVNRVLGTGSAESKAFLPFIDRYMYEERDAEKAEELVQFMQRHFVSIDEEFFTCLQTGYISLGMLTEAETVIERMVGLHINISEKQFHILIDAHAERNDMTAIYRIMKKMEDHGFIPDLHSYWWILEKCFSKMNSRGDMQESDSKLLRDVLHNVKDQGIRINTISFNFLQLFHHGSSRYTVLDRMEQILYILKHERVAPNAFVLNTLLNLCHTSDEMKEVIEGVEERTDVKATDAQLSMLIRTLLDEGKLQEAVVLLRDKLSENVQLAREVLWIALDHLFSKPGQSESMAEYFVLLTKHVNQISPCIPTSIIVALAQGGHPLKAIDLMQKLRVDFSLTPNIVMINSIVGPLVKQNQFDEIKRLINISTSVYHIGINAQTYVIILTECIRLKYDNRVDEFIELYTKGQFSSIREDEVKLFELLIEMHIEKGQLDKAERHFNTISLIARPSTHIMNLMLRAYINAGLISNAKTLIGRMQKGGILPDQETFQSLLSSHPILDNKERPALPLLMLRCMHNAGIHPEQRLLNAVQRHFEQLGDNRLLEAQKTLRQSLVGDNDELNAP